MKEQKTVQYSIETNVNFVIAVLIYSECHYQFIQCYKHFHISHSVELQLPCECLHFNLIIGKQESYELQVVLF